MFVDMRQSVQLFGVRLDLTRSVRDEITRNTNELQMLKIYAFYQWEKE